VPSGFTFGPLILDAAKRRLSSAGEPLGLSARHFDVLLALVAGAGRIVPKDDLIQAGWRDVAVVAVSTTGGSACAKAGAAARNASDVRTELATMRRTRRNERIVMVASWSHRARRLGGSPDEEAEKV